MQAQDIFSYITTEESRFQTEQVQVGDNWWWSFRNHVQLIFHLKNGVFYTGENNWLRAFKNIMEPLLNLSYWAEDIELKDVVFYIENRSGRVLSFLVKKYHDEVFVKKNNLDTLFDEITESDLDYGGALVQKTDTARPEILPLNSMAFCDQTDIFGGPIVFKYNFSPDKLRAMLKFGWGNTSNGATISLENLILLADYTKAPDGLVNAHKNRVTGKNIEVYVVRGCMPESYILDNGNMDDYYNQIQIVGFYKDNTNKKIGVILYRKPEEEGNLKFYTSKKIHGRALGRGEGEGLLHPQIWTNFLTIHKTGLLEAGSKVPLYTDDPEYTNKNRIQEMENLEITTIEDGKRIYQVPTVAPANIQLYERSINEWYEHAQLTGSAFDPILGREPVSGTTFRGQERTVQQGRGLHERRRGQRAKFIEEIYRDWIIPDMVKEILNGKKFLATLTSEDLTWIANQLAENYAYREQAEDIFNCVVARDKELLKQKFLQDFGKKGNKHLLEILKDEFRDVEVQMGINISSKQKDLVGLSDKILSIFQFIFTNPQAFQQAMQIPALSRSFQDILEYSGMNATDFSTLTSLPISSSIQPTFPQTPELKLATSSVV